MFYSLTIGAKELKLRLDTKNLIALEKAIGKNPVEILFSLDRGALPKITDVVYILHFSLQSLNNGYSLEKTFDLYDEYVANGGTLIDFISVLNEIFANSGLIQKANKNPNE